MWCKWRGTVESQTRRVGKWFKETVAPAEGGKEGLTVTAAILQMIRPEKSHHGMWDDNGFCRMWNTNLWNRTSIGEASFLCIHLGREVARGWFMATHNQTMATNLYLNWFLGKWPPTSIVRLHPTSECERINFTIWAQTSSTTSSRPGDYKTRSRGCYHSVLRKACGGAEGPIPSPYLAAWSLFSTVL